MILRKEWNFNETGFNYLTILTIRLSHILLNKILRKLNLIITTKKRNERQFLWSGNFEEVELNCNVLSIKMIIYLFLRMKILDWRCLLRSYLFFSLLFFPSSFIFSFNGPSLFFSLSLRSF